jgi:DNA repair exonuclease SbcCD ATPase subunit
MRIIGLQVENWLNLRAVSISPNGQLVRVTGKNGAGKSALFSAIFCALAGKKYHPSMPVRRGSKKATVRVLLGETEVELIVILRVGENTHLDLESPEGARFRSPQAMLEAMIGALMFDPSEFSRLPAAKRLELLRSLVKLEIDVERLDQQNDRDFTLRTDWNRKVRSLTERVTTLAPTAQLEADVKPIDIGALTQRMAESSEHNAAIDKRRDRRERVRREIDEQRQIAKDKRLEAHRLLAEAEAAEHAAEVETQNLERAEPLPERIDVTQLRDEINAAMVHNTACDVVQRQRDALSTATKDLEAARIMSQNLTEAIESRDKQKADAIAAAKMPIEGLGFGDGDVTFNGLPFDQESTGKRLRVSAAIGMALNPKLRVMFIRDANLLDTEGREILEQLCEERGYQMFMEFTQDEATTGIHFVDGDVAAIDGEPVEPIEEDEAEEEEATV